MMNTFCWWHDQSMNAISMYVAQIEWNKPDLLFFDSESLSVFLKHGLGQKFLMKDPSFLVLGIYEYQGQPDVFIFKGLSEKNSGKTPRRPSVVWRNLSWFFIQFCGEKITIKLTEMFFFLMNGRLFRFSMNKRRQFCHKRCAFEFGLLGMLLLSSGFCYVKLLVLSTTQIKIVGKSFYRVFEFFCNFWNTWVTR